MKLKKMLRSPVFTIALFAIAGALLLSTSIGATRALLTFFSETYYAQFVMRDIGITLNENGKEISHRDYSADNFKDDSAIEEKVKADNANWKDKLYWDAHNGALLGNMLGDEEELVLGKTYKEKLTVTNTSGKDKINITDENNNEVETSKGIPEYVRLTVYKYWLKPKTDENGNIELDTDGKTPKYEQKDVTLDPSLIHLEWDNIVENGSTEKGWIIDKDASSKTNNTEKGDYKERTVLYYTKQLQPMKDGDDYKGEDEKHQQNRIDADMETLAATKLLSIDASLGAHLSETKVEKDGKYTTYTYVYTYDKYRFCIEAQADAVQNQNAEQAILSAWGRKVDIAKDGTLSLKD